jgi:hypothetical protein
LGRKLFPHPTLKRKLTGLTMSLDKFKTKWAGVTKILIKDYFARAFSRWLIATIILASKEDW